MLHDVLDGYYVGIKYLPIILMFMIGDWRNKGFWCRSAKTAVSGEMDDENPPSSMRYKATTAGGHREIDVATSTLRFSHLDVSDNEY